MLRDVLIQYGIDPAVSADYALTLLEKQRQKTLRKLNHVFGNAKKETELEEELNLLEEAIEELEKAGGAILSLDDVKLETRGLSQTQVAFAENDEDADGEAMSREEAAQMAEMEEMRKLEKIVLADNGQTMEVGFKGIYRLVEYYRMRGSWVKMEKWLTYGIQWFHFKGFISDLYRVCRDRDDGLRNPKQVLYWARKAADTGDKDASYEVGLEYARESSPFYDLNKAAVCFAKAADKEHPKAYLKAGAAYFGLDDCRRAEICFQAADKIGVPEAAYYLGLIFDGDGNSCGDRQPDKALMWYEKAYRQKPDGDVCLGLGELYAEMGRQKEAVSVLLRGKNEFQSEECAEALMEMAGQEF